MPDTHIIPVLENDLHTLSEECVCKPVLNVDLDGTITYIHINLLNDHLVDNLDIT